MNKGILLAVFIIVLIALFYYLDTSSTPVQQADYYIEAWEGDVIYLDVDKLVDIPIEYQTTFSKPFNNQGIWITEEGDAGVYFANVSIYFPSKNSTTRSTIKTVLKSRTPDAKLETPKAISVKEGSVVQFGVSTYGSNHTIPLEAQNLPQNASFENGFFKWEPSYELVQTPALFKKLRYLGISLPYSKTYTVVFSTPDVSRKTRIRVIDSNRPPSFPSQIKRINTIEGDPIKITPNAADPDNDYLFFTLLSEEGEPIDPEFKAQSEHNGELLTLVASDGLETAVQLIQINVQDIYRPFKSLPHSIFLKEGEKKEFLINVPLSINNYSLTCDCPDYVNLIDNLLIINPGYIVENNSLTDQAVLKFQSSDFTFNHTLNITIKDKNRLPEVLNATPEKLFVVYVREPIEFSLNVSDPDGDELSLRWSFSRFNKEIVNKTSFWASFSYPGEKHIIAEISDGKDTITKEWIADVRKVVEYAPVSPEEKEPSEPEEPSEEPLEEPIEDDYLEWKPVTFVI